jgi:hypothetical protein
MAGPVQLARDFDDLCLGSADARREACLVAGTRGGRCFIGRGRLDPLEVDLVDGEQHADDAEEPLEHLRRVPGRDPRQAAPRYRPEDVYLGNLLGRLEALNPGVTTMLAWFYCAQSPEHAGASPGAAQYLSHELIVRLQARPRSRLPCLVLGDGSVDLGFLDLLGGCAVPQGLERVVLVHRNHDSGFATETDDVVTVVLRRLHAHATMLARRAANRPSGPRGRAETPRFVMSGIAFSWASGS